MTATRLTFTALLRVCDCATPCDHEAEECEVTGLFTPGAPAAWGGGPDAWAPGDPDELDVVSVTCAGRQVACRDDDIDDLTALARDEYDGAARAWADDAADRRRDDA